MKEILKNSYTKFLLKILSELNLIDMSSTKQFIYKEITIIQAYVSELLKALKSTIECESQLLQASARREMAQTLSRLRPT